MDIHARRICPRIPENTGFLLISDNIISIKRNVFTFGASYRKDRVAVTTKCPCQMPVWLKIA
jgi:hypothetical protein